MDMLQLDLKVPRNHWTALSREDQSSFMQLHLHFIRQQKEHMKDRRNNTFFNDIQCLLQFIEYSPIRKDDRAICVGLACSGPFVCVNTQQIKIILGRCKSSINNSFQMIGYEAVKTKGKSRDAILAIIPALSNEQNTLRKWTVRCASEASTCCFVSRFQMVNLPLISDDDLYDEKKSVRSTMAAFQRQRQGNGKSRHLIFNIQNQQSPTSPPSPSNGFPQFQQQAQPPFIAQQPFMSLSPIQQQPNFYQNQGQFQQAPSMFQPQATPNFFQSNQQQNQLFLPPMNFGGQQGGMQFQSNMQQQPIVMQPIITNQAQQQVQIQPTEENEPLTMMHHDNFDVGISFLSDNDEDDMSMSSIPNFDITPSYSLDYLADYNFDDENNGNNFGFSKNVSSPLDPSSLFNFPRSQSASFNPNYD